ncbi:ATP-binding protein [Aeromonas dhakensis]|uniref:ATP-binding protein n=1 Tax=Aeromonas dhakensis TaxID=196024 RepID=UPI0019816EC3|nr:ATP-binding protein [Aeromonas dhakensis]MBW3733500.1 ATP-binding protein [Aeromonas dhakensis]QSR54669.1 ATP-binding protein [Aeromonas dhakensis]
MNLFDKNELNRELDAHFVANAGVKDIVGKGLIYNDNVAIIELIKNAKDAHSEKVVLDFQDITSSNNRTTPRIVIKDYGVGMTRSDIKEKWLNIAYSEKKNDKRNIYAGNKGVGRFSCDRLGTELDLYTKSNDDTYLKLSINWVDFENRGRDEQISSIPLKIEIIDQSDFLKHIDESTFTNGTVLVIKNLRSSWNEPKLKKLLAEIEKFSPNLDNSFTVYFKSNIKFKDHTLQNKVNKKVTNNILDKLSFKTTHIKSLISKDGEYIETELLFQGEIIYKYKAKNPYKTLKDVSIEIHYLDTLSKSFFSKSFGIKPNSYGSVFLFYNGFRISPYGNEKNDWLGLDQRKSQGTSRYLGTRDIIGKININDDAGVFSVITSREGLAHNQAYYELVAYDSDEKAYLGNGKSEYGYVTSIIRQLENFIVRGADWNRLVDKLNSKQVVFADDVIKDPSRFTVKVISSKMIEDEVLKIKNSNLDIFEFEISHETISKIQNINEQKLSGFITEFVDATIDKSYVELSPREKGFVKKIIESSNRKIDDANNKLKNVQLKNEIIEKSLDIEKKKHAYLLATRRTLSPDADGLIHTIKINSIEIREGLDSIIDGVTYDEMTKEEILRKLGAIKLYAVKSLKLSEIVTRSGFDQEIDIRCVDIVQYIDEYIKIYEEPLSNGVLNIIFEDNNSFFQRSLSVLNLSIVIDNIFSNASKWGARNIIINCSIIDSRLIVVFSDDGYGLSNAFLDCPDEIFELGVREEPPEAVGGSGIGLYYSKQLLQEMNASIKFIGNGVILSGASFEVVFE